MSIILDGTSGITTPSATVSGVLIGSPVRGGLILSNAVASTSGTSVDFTDVPSWVKRITVMFNGVSTNGTSFMQIQIGDAGGVETSGYSGAGSGMDSSVGTSAVTTGFLVRIGNASNILSGQLVISAMGGNSWVASGIFGSTLGASFISSGSKTLSDIISQVRITTVNGTDTFDAGTINIMYEG